MDFKFLAEDAISRGRKSVCTRHDDEDNFCGRCLEEAVIAAIGAAFYIGTVEARSGITGARVLGTAVDDLKKGDMVEWEIGTGRFRKRKTNE